MEEVLGDTTPEINLPNENSSAGGQPGGLAKKGCGDSVSGLSLVLLSAATRGPGYMLPDP